MAAYIIETLQTASGTFMGTTDVQFADVQDARTQAQVMANRNGTITRVVLMDAKSPYSYVLDPNHQLTMADYFYPVYGN